MEDMMKLSIKLIALMLILALTLPMLFSCGLAGLEPDVRALKIMERASEKMNTAESCTATTELEMHFYLDKTEMKASVLTNTYDTGIGTDSYATHMDSTTRIYSDSQLEEKITTAEGYRDGVMYARYSNGSSSNAIKSNISLENLLPAEGEDSNAIALTDVIATAANKNSVKNEDDSWTLTFSGMSEDALEGFINTLGSLSLYVSFGETPLGDVEVEIVVTESYYVKSTSIDYIFTDAYGNVPEKGSDDDKATGLSASKLAYNYVYGVPSFKITTEYSMFNSTTLPSVNLGDFNEVYDLNAVYAVEDAFSSLALKDSGDFILTTETSVKYNGETETDTEKATVSYSGVYSRFKHNTVAQSSAAKYEISYTGEEKIVTVTVTDLSGFDRSNKSYLSSNDIEERLYVYSLQDSASFNIEYITEAQHSKVGADDLYTFTMKKGNKTLIDSLVNATRMTCTSSKGELSVTISEDGEIEEYVYVLTCKLVYSGRTMDVTIKKTYRA